MARCTLVFPDMASWGGCSFNVCQHPEVPLKNSGTNTRESPFKSTVIGRSCAIIGGETKSGGQVYIQGYTI